MLNCINMWNEIVPTLNQHSGCSQESIVKIVIIIKRNLKTFPLRCFWTWFIDILAFFLPSTHLKQAGSVSHHFISSHSSKFQLSKAVLLPSSGLPQKVLLFYMSHLSGSPLLLSGKLWGPGHVEQAERGTRVITWCHLRAPSKTPVPIIKRMKGAPLSLHPQFG